MEETKVVRRYQWKRVLVWTCKWCEGTGRTMGSWHSEPCLNCNGVPYRYENQRVLVEETVYE